MYSEGDGSKTFSFDNDRLLCSLTEYCEETVENALVSVEGLLFTWTFYRISAVNRTSRA